MGFGVDFFSGVDFLFRWGFPMRWHLLRWRRFLKEIMEGDSADPMPSHTRGNPELKCSSWELQICYLSFEELTTLEPNFSARKLTSSLGLVPYRYYDQFISVWPITCPTENTSIKWLINGEKNENKKVAATL